MAVTKNTVKNLLKDKGVRLLYGYDVVKRTPKKRRQQRKKQPLEKN